MKNKQIALGVLPRCMGRRWRGLWPGIGRDAQEDQGIEYIHPRLPRVGAAVLFFQARIGGRSAIPLIFARMSRVPSKNNWGSISS